MPPLNLSWVHQAEQTGQPWKKCVEGYLASVQKLLWQDSEVLFRGLHALSPTRLEEFVAGVLGDPMPYLERPTPSRMIERMVYLTHE